MLMLMLMLMIMLMLMLMLMGNAKINYFQSRVDMKQLMSIKQSSKTIDCQTFLDWTSRLIVCQTNYSTTVLSSKHSLCCLHIGIRKCPKNWIGKCPKKRAANICLAGIIAMVVMKSLMGNDWWQATAQGGDIPIAPLPSVLFAAIIAVALPVALLPLQPPASASQSYWDDTETQRFVCSNHYCCIASCPQTLLPLNLIACPQLTSSSSQFNCNYSMLCGCRSQVIKNCDRC